MLNNKIIDRFGFYIVDSKPYDNKVEALIEATKTNSGVYWNFNDHILTKYNWLTPPSLSLKEVYKQRALQLREKYDYIVLNYSGGSDSQNVLHAFLDNKIKIDEILVRWPRERTKDIYTPTEFGSADNYLSEWDLTLLPDLKWLAANHPEIHIEFYDFSIEVEDFFKSDLADNDPWFANTTGLQLSPSHAVRWRTSMDRYKKMFHDKGIRGCQLWGIDKPRMCYTNNEFFVFYLDSIAGAVIHFDAYDDMYSACELFYWTPDMPEVVKVQTHIIMDFFKKNRGLLPIIAPHAAKSYTLRNAYETIVRSIIYPYWEFTRFQAAKPSSLYYCELDSWMYNKANRDDKVLAAWRYSIDYVKQNVDEKYIMCDQYGKEDGLVGMITPYFKIGELPQ